MALLAIALFASLGSNYRLARRAWDEHAKLIELRLDPTGAASASASNPAPSGERRIVFFGDSRIEGWPSPPHPPGGQSVNRGRAGETTSQMALRLDREMLATPPAIAVLELGINDLTAIGLFPERADAIVTACMRNLDRIVDRLSATGAQVVVLTVWPIGPVPLLRRPFWSTRTGAAIRQVNHHLRRLARPGVTVVDCDQLLAPSGRLERGYDADTVHVTDAAYRALDHWLAPRLAAIAAQPAPTVD
jgi:lysophospholipase L1-like esterase